MRSIPGAMVWEIFRNGKWNLLLGLLGANAMPALLLTALSHHGAIDPTDQAFVMIHMMMIQISMFAFGTCIIAAQGQPSRLFTSPLTNSTLATWHMLPAMLLAFLELSVSTLVLNAMFHLNWPIWGPALFFAVLMASVQAALWQTEKTAWIVLSLTGVTAVMALWFKSRHGAVFGAVTHLWVDVTPLEVITLLVVAVVAHRFAISGIARNRRGDILKPLGIVAWIQRVFDPPQYAGPDFVSPSSALYWAEWRKKGWAMPVCTAVVLILFLVGWAIANRNPKELFEGFVAGGGLLSVAGLIGALIMGNMGPNDGAYEMGHFLATRPITNRDLSQTVLKVAGKSVLISWLIWAVAFLIAYLLMLACRVTVPPIFPDKIGWWYFPATLIGFWVVVSAGMSLGLTGQSWLFMELLCGLLALFFVGLPVSEYTLNKENRELLALGLTTATGVLFVLMTAWWLVKARRRSLITLSTAWLASAAWAIPSTAVMLVGVLKPTVPLPVHILVVGILALAVAPFATAPLALEWNRTR